jgi:NADPH-ferrihemoprotein reductase
VTIYYATQTGTAESFAQQLEREGPDHGFHIRVVDLEDVGTVEDYLTDTAFGNKGQDETARAIVLAATYGEGEPTDNANEMVQLLKEKLTQRESGDES